jgi:uncharacterized metal-binding protein (TIGR02443 family)
MREAMRCEFSFRINDDGDRERCGEVAIACDPDTEEGRCAAHTDEAMRAEEARMRKLYRAEMADARFCPDCRGQGRIVGWSRDKLGIYECVRCGAGFDENSAEIGILRGEKETV